VRIVPFILAGGQGTRLWPASRPGKPKQLLALAGETPLIRRTYERVNPLAGGGPVYVVTDADNREAVERALPEVRPEQVWIEPQGRNTGPSVSWALHEAEPEHAGEIAVFFPSDHVFQDPSGLRQAMQAGAAAARGGRIALLGVRPTRPETGYGYIEGGGADSSGVREVRRFLEKPSGATAAALMKRTDVFWNSGIFIVPIGTGLDLVRSASPELARFVEALPGPATARRAEGPGRPQLAAAFASVSPVPFDMAVLERTSQRALVPLEGGWSDLGSWQAVWEAGPQDETGNVVGRGGLALESEGCLLAGDGRTIAALGVKDLVIVAWGDAVLVCPRDRAQDVRKIVEALT
jgi:mannose-1-phosphate guanylyltransferase/mannose-6-phosphate isomerase